MRCIICDSNNWENIDIYRFKPHGMAICNTCSMISYPTLWKSEEEIKAYYRKDYRSCPTSGNLFTGQRKIYFHHAFLNDLFEKWKKENRGEIEVCEIGAAYGLALSWVKDIYPQSKVSGTELTISYRRVAYHEHGIELTEDFDDTKKYDLIMSYKVAEHQLDVDKMLIKYRSCLKEDGLMYLSVPIWFDQMNCFGVNSFDLEYYYDKNHVNVWTKKLFESLLKKVGFEIIKQDHLIYDSTYLLKACEPKTLDKNDFDDIKKIKSIMERIKLAHIAYNESRFSDAIIVYPNYPQAYTSYFEINRKEFHEKGWEYTKENFIDKMKKDCGECGEFFITATDISMRFKKFEEAIKYAENGLKIKPNNPGLLILLINTMREIAIHSDTEEKKIHYFNQARQISRYLKDVSLQHTKEAIDLIYLFDSKIPIPSEIKQN